MVVSRFLIFIHRRILAHLFAENSSPPGLTPFLKNISKPLLIGEANSKRINYDQFCVIGSLAPVKAQNYFKAENFLKFRRDKYGRINCSAFFQYVCRKNNMIQNRIRLTYYDTGGNGYLTEQDMENFVYDLIRNVR